MLLIGLKIFGEIKTEGNMGKYISAAQGLNNTVIYTDASGKHFKFSGGTWTWRNNNPGNLAPGDVSRRNSQIGKAGGFAVFPDKETGHRALLDCLKTTYANSSIDELVEGYAPSSHGNNVKVYKKFLHDKTGVRDDKKVKDFTDSEFEKLWKAIEQMEGYKEGDITPIPDIVHVHKYNGIIYDYDIRGRGWTSKSESIILAKNGVLDVIVCTSRNKNEYLRARHGSPVNGSLSRLVVKSKKLIQTKHE